MIDPKKYAAPPALLAGRVILVTGASRGLGRAIALAFAQHGATVVLHSLHQDPLAVVYDEITDAGYPKPMAIALDLDKAGTRDYDHLAYAIESQLGRLDGMVHSASHLEKLSALEHQTVEEWSRMLRVNLVAPFALTQACTRLLRAAPDASVIFTSETHASRPAAYWGGYAVSKAGLEALARIQADEWSGSENLRANVVVPGPIASPLRSKTHPGEVAGQLPRPEALTPLYLFLMGADAKGVSGQTFFFQD